MTIRLPQQIADASQQHIDRALVTPGLDKMLAPSHDTTIGRDVNNAIVIEDMFASAEHAILTFRGRAWYVEDLGSTNGTFVNGAPVEGVAPLGFGDVIQVGQVRLRLERPRADRSRR